MMHMTYTTNGGQLIETRITKAGEISFYHPSTGLLFCQAEDLPLDGHAEIFELCSAFITGFRKSLLHHVDKDTLKMITSPEQEANLMIPVPGEPQEGPHLKVVPPIS